MTKITSIQKIIHLMKTLKSEIHSFERRVFKIFDNIRRVNRRDDYSENKGLGMSSSEWGFDKSCPHRRTYESDKKKRYLSTLA